MEKFSLLVHPETGISGRVVSESDDAIKLEVFGESGESDFLVIEEFTGWKTMKLKGDFQFGELVSGLRESKTDPNYVFEDLILEVDIKAAIAAAGKKFDKRRQSDRSCPNKDEDLERDLIQADPTRNQEYGRWIISCYAKGGINLWEDVLARVAPALQAYHHLKSTRRLEGPKDIFQIKSLNDLEDLVDAHADKLGQSNRQEHKSEQNKAEEESDLIYRDSNVVVVSPKTHFAACYWGQKTRWCTASANSPGLFDNYTGRGTLYIFLPKSPSPADEKYQLHKGDSIRSSYIADSQDKTTSVLELIAKRPEFTKAVDVIYGTNLLDRMDEIKMFQQLGIWSNKDSLIGIAKLKEADFKKYKPLFTNQFIAWFNEIGVLAFSGFAKLDKTVMEILYNTYTSYQRIKLSATVSLWSVITDFREIHLATNNEDILFFPDEEDPNDIFVKKLRELGVSDPKIKSALTFWAKK